MNKNCFVIKTTYGDFYWNDRDGWVKESSNATKYLSYKCKEYELNLDETFKNVKEIMMENILCL